MKQFRYETSSEVCSSEILLTLSDDCKSIIDVKFKGGCAGSLTGIARLAASRNVDEVIALLEGVPCGAKCTSCPDQLAVMLKKIRAAKMV